MRHCLIYHGGFERNFPNLKAGATTGAITATATALQAAVPHVTNTAFAQMGNLKVQDSATTSVNTDVNLTLTKSADPVSGSDVEHSQEIEYTLHYANTGSTDAKGVTITDTIPTGTTYKNGTATCSTACMEREVATTFAPASASPSAMARPMPCVPPMATADLPLRGFISFGSCNPRCNLSISYFLY